MERLRTVRVALFGTGGVGSWCAEGLVRSGVEHLTLIDFDRVAASNINRQLPALPSTVGRLKAEVLAERLRSINPEADISVRAERYSADTADTFDLDAYDYVLDCIDSLADKALLVRRTCSSRATLFSSMGAALRIDPSRIHTAPFSKAFGCPLARSLRQHLRSSGEPLSRDFVCVFSDEPVSKDAFTMEETPEGKHRTNGSLVHITASFGMRLCGLVLESARP